MIKMKFHEIVNVLNFPASPTLIVASQAQVARSSVHKSQLRKICMKKGWSNHVKGCWGTSIDLHKNHNPWWHESLSSITRGQSRGKYRRYRYDVDWFCTLLGSAGFCDQLLRFTETPRPKLRRSWMRVTTTSPPECFMSSGQIGVCFFVVKRWRFTSETPHIIHIYMIIYVYIYIYSISYHGEGICHITWKLAISQGLLHPSCTAQEDCWKVPGRLHCFATTSMHMCFFAMQKKKHQRAHKNHQKPSEKNWIFQIYSPPLCCGHCYHRRQQCTNPIVDAVHCSPRRLKCGIPSDEKNNEELTFKCNWATVGRILSMKYWLFNRDPYNGLS